MKEVPGKEFQQGNTKVIVYLKLAFMTSEERKAWFESEKEKGNPVLKEIAKAIDDCYRD